MNKRVIWATALLLLLIIQLTPYTTAAQPSDPFKEIFKATFSDPTLRRYWSSILFTRYEGGSQLPYLAVTGQYLNKWSWTFFYNISERDYVKGISMSGYKLLEIGDKEILQVAVTGAKIISKDTLTATDVYVGSVDYIYYYKDGDTVYIVPVDGYDYSGGKHYVRIGIIKYVYGESGSTNWYKIRLSTVEEACGGELYLSPKVKPTATDGSRIITAIRLKGGNYPVAFMVFSTEDGSLNLEKCIVHDFGSKGENARANMLFYPNTRQPAYWSYSDGVYPYIAGFDGSDELYVYKYGWSSLKILENPEFKKDGLYSNVKIVVDSQGRYHIAVLDKDGDTPRLIFLDPEDLRVEKVITLDGYKASYPVMAKGYYYGSPALYIAAVGYVIVVSVDDMEPVYSLEVEGVSDIYQIDYTTSTAGDTLLVRGQPSNPEKGTVIVYNHIGLRQGTILRFDVDKKLAHVGESVKATITLASITGEPLKGRVVTIEKLDHGTWTPVATAVTGDDGKATVDIGLTGRGEWILRARYSGSQDDAPSWSRTITIKVYERASTRINVPKTWIETLPLPVEVTARSLDTGAPMGGVWVTLYANVSGGSVAIASGKTGVDGKAVISIRLPAGSYTLQANVADPHISTEDAETVGIKITPPLQEVGEGPYIAPIGRVVSYGTALTEPGREARLLFAFYYGEKLVKPDSIWAEAVPSLDVSLEEAGDGVYIARLTPPTTGTYTVVVHAVYAGAHYMGAGYVYSINITGKVDEWGEEVRATLSELEQLSQTLTSYLEEINSTLTSLNVTRLVGIMEEVQGKTLLLVNMTQDVSNGISDLLSRAERIETIVTSNGDTIIAMLGSMEDLLSGVNASIQEVTNGFAIVNTSIGLVVASISSLQATIENITGDIYTIKTSIGEVTINLQDLAKAVEDGNKNITQAMARINDIAGFILHVQDGVAKIIDHTGNIETVLVEDLKPKVIAVGDKLALVDTQLGLMATKTDNILAKLENLGNTTQDTSQAITELTKKMDELSAKMDSVKEKVDKLKPEDMIARGIGGVAILLGVIAVALSSRKK
ncbi:MAG: hypothetical protein GSR86_00010 [Desulfurococcales archaeon]|nr:hypothetical protein [Desulfurococcales archaeon]